MIGKPKEIWERLNAIAKKSGRPLDHAAKETGISSGTISDWKHSYPRVDRLASVVDFYNSSLDMVVFGEVRGQVTLSEEEINLLTEYRKLDLQNRTEILGIIDLKLNTGKRGEDSYKSLEATA